MQSPVAVSRSDPRRSAVPAAATLRWGTVAACAVMLAGCAAQAPGTAVIPGGTGRYFDPVLGVWASPKLVEEGEAVPRGGGGYLVGRPYTIGGRSFVPNANPQGYTVVGTASWYGDAFHGRRTANGEIFDKGSISAAHPTLPLPSYVRVTNLKNGSSIIVRVNDRGPYHGGRVMDVSQRVAEALSFKGEGTARIRVEYIGRASLAGSDDRKLLASLRTDGGAAGLDGMAEPVQVADAGLPPEEPAPFPVLPRVASLPIFRRGHLAPRAAPAPAPVEESLVPPEPTPVALGRPFPPPGSRPLAARPPAGHRGAPARDPFYRPLFAPARPEPRSAISFAAPAPKGGRVDPEAVDEAR